MFIYFGFDMYLCFVYISLRRPSTDVIGAARNKVLLFS
jgi:hypothetical protein